jgi:hypothetical protein
MDTKNVSVSNKKSNDTKFCVRLSQELKECNKKYKTNDEDVVCNYFFLVFQIKCMGGIIYNSNKMNNLDKNE